MGSNAHPGPGAHADGCHRFPVSVVRAWSVLKRVQRLSTHVLESRYPAHAGSGNGIVERELYGQELIFDERGTWMLPNGTGTAFRNRCRWRLEEKLLTLEHLRHGEGNPVLLAVFEPREGNVLRPKAPHWCDPDTYDVEMVFEHTAVTLYWTVAGPAKDYRMRTVYSADSALPSDTSDSLA